LERQGSGVKRRRLLPASRNGDRQRPRANHRAGPKPRSERVPEALPRDEVPGSTPRQESRYLASIVAPKKKEADLPPSWICGRGDLRSRRATQGIDAAALRVVIKRKLRLSPDVKLELGVSRMHACRAEKKSPYRSPCKASSCVPRGDNGRTAHRAHRAQLIGHIANWPSFFYETLLLQTTLQRGAVSFVFAGGAFLLPSLDRRSSPFCEPPRGHHAPPSDSGHLQKMREKGG
jgi:hypothetical protein